ncbi:type II secretion system F family protein [Methanohalophilus halophilus]|uniref:Flagellar protein FlaJ n=1 Tax=Methanohalophilus halophilus TaxID=2177 RepID=A0A1L3Q334_9EURY|nr:type II secretion system F family protein [Methanohalophilus halophilus]APH39277.1 secretion system protein [Methanohalophilus halophilus]RNI09658.1 type II secretion system F family protein [Methanohalophilus halophilus]SDW51548.1 flagellar protein FlaJ [Methanohalophilus halophilus]
MKFIGNDPVKRNEPLSEEKLQELEDLTIKEKLEKAKEHVTIKEFAKKPKEFLFRQPPYSIVFSGPLSLIFLIIGLELTWGTPFIDDVIIFSVLISISLPSYTFFKKRRFINQVEEYIPNFLRDMAEMSRAGLTLPAAVNTLTKADYGVLTEEVKQMDASLSWGISFEVTLENFAQRLNTPLISRSVALITQANRAGGRTSSVLDAAARDANEIKTLQRERKGNMVVYVVISYMSFLVFLFVVLMLTSKFVPTMAEAGNAAAAAGAGSQFIGAFDPDHFTRILFHASVIQGFVTGIVAGQMGEGQVSAGLKHSLLLTIIAWATFTFLI